MRSFLRSVHVLLLLVAMLFFTTGVAAQSQDEDLALKLLQPNEGQTFYAGPESLVYVIPISGFVESRSFQPEQISVDIGIYQAETRVTGQILTPHANGEFKLFATVNPGENKQPYTADFISCADKCHYNTSFPFQNGEWGAIVNLPAGPITIIVTVSDPDGRTVSMQRNIIVDLSDYAIVPVQIELAADSQLPLDKIPVTGSTWMYMWRARYATRETDGTGLVYMRVEALSQASTTYRFQVLPTIVNGILFESIAPAEIILPPGATQGPHITLQLKAKLATVQGQIDADDPVPPLDIWAIDVSNGEARTASSSEDGSFTFENLPIREYLFTADPDFLAHQALSMAGETIDLSTNYSPDVNLQMVPLEGNSCQGTVMDLEGQELPFAWVRNEQSNKFGGVATDSGRFDLFGITEEKATLVASAPGYYSQAQVVEAANNDCAGLDYKLTRRPDTRSLGWGDGQIIFPAETQLSISGQHYFLERGWIWGQNQSPAPILIQRGNIEIQLSSGKFAMEDIPGRPAWFYLFAGEGNISVDNGMVSIPIRSGVMIALDETADPVIVPFDPVVVKTLNSYDKMPVPEIIEPTFIAQISNRLASVGIDIVVLVTFVTYSLILASGILLPLVVFFKRHKKNS